MQGAEKSQDSFSRNEARDEWKKLMEENMEEVHNL